MDARAVSDDPFVEDPCPCGYCQGLVDIDADDYDPAEHDAVLDAAGAGRHENCEWGRKGVAGIVSEWDAGLGLDEDAAATLSQPQRDLLYRVLEWPRYRNRRQTWHEGGLHTPPMLVSARAPRRVNTCGGRPRARGTSSSTSSRAGPDSDEGEPAPRRPLLISNSGRVRS